MKTKQKLNTIEPLLFTEGNLEGIKLYLTREYKKIAYPNGTSDSQMISDIENSNPDGKVIFDVGSFIGASSLIFSKLVGKKGKVIGFEPNKFNMKRIEENLLLNPILSKNIIISPLALSDKKGEITMTLSDEIDNGYSSTSRLNQSHPSLHNNQLPLGFKEVTVEVSTLDDFVKQKHLIPDIIKVDIEGAEYDFLVGSWKTIEKYKPNFYIEMHSEFCALKCTEFLINLGYICEVLYEEDDNRIMVKSVYSEESLYAKNKELNTNMESFLNCNSWKITKPLRNVRRSLLDLKSKVSKYDKNTK